MADKKKEKTVEAQAFPIELDIPAGLISRYANHVVVQAGPQECNILFFEIRPPMLMGSPEEIQEQAKKITSVKSECVSRIIVPVNIMPAIIGALTDVTEKMTARSQLGQEGKDSNADNGKGKGKSKGD